MSQHDLNIANQGFPAFRADLNDALVALGSTNSGATAPATTFANQLWYDTANNILKIRNEDNDAWISIVTLDQTADTVSAITAATVNAGALNATGNVVLGDSSTDTLNVGNGGLVKDASGNVGIGTATPSGKRLYVLGGAAIIDQVSASGSTLTLNRSGNPGSVAFQYTGTETGQIAAIDGGGLNFYTGSTPTERMRINSSGDVGIGVSTITSSGGRRVLQVGGGASGGMLCLGNASTENPNPRLFQNSTNDLGIAAGVSTGVISFYTNDTEQMRLTANGFLQYNSGYGSIATVYGCRAWVNFNGTGTIAVRASGNISSIGDNATGDYTVNFASAMPDANYVAHVTSGVNGATWGIQQLGVTYSASQLQFKLFEPSGNPTDNNRVNVSIVR